MTIQKLVMTAGTTVLTCALAVAPSWADPDRGYGGHGDKSYGGHGEGYGRGGHGMGGAMMEMMMHGGTGHLIRHLLKHEKELGLSAEQVTKLKEMQLNMDKTRIKMEADIQVIERELKALIEDEKSDLGAIEAKLKQSQDTQVGLRLASIKARREVLALLTPEQRTKQQAEHDRAMQQHRGLESERGKGHGNPHQGMGMGSGNPHQGMAPGSPHQGQQGGDKGSQSSR